MRTGTRRRWPDAVYDAAQEYLDSHPGVTAAASGAALPKIPKGPHSETPEPEDTPQESTVRDCTLQARLEEVTRDLRSGRITAAEGNRVTKKVRDELREVESAMRAAKLTRRIGEG